MLAQEMATMQFTKTFASPVGALKLIATDAGLSAVLWPNDDPKRVRVGDLVVAPEHPILVQAECELRAYFAGERTSFSVPLAVTGTPFQKKAWAALLTIPYGETRCYGALARQIGHAKASRAFGAANGRNPISIIVPCHRVIGASGALTGFAGGLDAKRHLLALEARGRARQAA
jgi:methylated-DNA-[protein]-cysteine S-methyltransferase